MVHPALPVNTLAELIAHAKANPGKVNYGSAGSGGITHLAGELLKVEAGIDIVHVPYKGAAPAVNDLLGGQVQMGIFDVPVVLPHIRAGKLKALAITSLKRSAALPEVPTTVELGYAKVLSDNWYGLVGPPGMPQADPETHPCGSHRGAQFARTDRAVRQGERRADAFVAGGVLRLSRAGPGEVVRGRERDRLQGRLSGVQPVFLPESWSSRSPMVWSAQ